MHEIASLPPSSYLYYALYLATLTLHGLLVSYVVFGSSLVALGSCREGWKRRLAPALEALVDWLPFALGAAITAGVAPLLFIQILYKEAFYTANLLLFARWMAIIPALVVGFYGLYWLKSSAPKRVPRLARFLRFVPALCFLFVAFSWTQNHTLMNESGDWVAFYIDAPLAYRPGQIALRAATWLVLAVPVGAAGIVLQLSRRRDLDPGLVRTLAGIAVAGVVVGAALSLGAYFASAQLQATVALNPGLAGAVLLFAVVVLLSWVLVLVRGRASRHTLQALTASTCAAALGATLLREGARLQSFDLGVLAEHQREAASDGGLILFLVFFALNAGLCVWACRLTLRSLKGRPGLKEATSSAPPRSSREQ